MDKFLNSPKLSRLRAFMISGRYMVILCVCAAMFTVLEWNVLGVLVFACIVGFTLVVCEDMLATFMPFMLICLIGAKCYNSFSIFIQFIPLGIVLIGCILFHFIVYYKKPDFSGSLFPPMLFVSAAVALGGVGFISAKEYFSGVSIFYILSLGIGMALLYVIFYTHLQVRKSYSMIQKVSLIMVLTGTFACFGILSYYLMHINEVLETDGLLYMQWRNNYSTFLMLSIPFAFLRGHKKPYSIVLGFLFFFCILLTGSRGGLVFGAIEMVMCCAMFMLYDKRRRLTYVAICGCLLFALLIFFRQFITFFSATFDRLLSAITGLLIGEQNERRHFQYMRGIEDFLSNPIFGTGIGYMGNRDVYASADFCIAWYHCEPIQIAASFGSVGIAAYVYQFVRRMVLLWKKPTMFNMTVFLSYISLELMSLVNPGIFSPIPYLLIVTMLFAIVERCNAGEAQKNIITAKTESVEDTQEKPEPVDTAGHA